MPKAVKKSARTNRTPKKVAEAPPEVPETTAVATHSDATKAAALKAFGELGTVTAACQAAKVARRTWYDWIENDPAFGALVLEATEDVTDELEAEAIKRAVNGSDTLIIFLLKSRRPRVYREKQEITVVSEDVRGRLARQAEVIAGRAVWPREELFRALGEVWT